MPGQAVRTRFEETVSAWYHGVDVDYLHQFWEGEMDLAIRDASLFARNAGGNQVPLSELVIVGSKLTTWLQNPDNL